MASPRKEFVWMKRGQKTGGAVLFLACLAATGLVAAQDGRISITSPGSGDEIHAGDPLVLEFEALGGVAGPYDVDLYIGEDMVFAWCSMTEGCDIDDGSAVFTVPTTVDVDTGYSVVVTERSSSVSGTSESFEVLPAQSTSSSSIDRSADFQEIGGGGGAVDDMNIALVIVATICGVVLLATLCAACFMVSRRKASDPSKPADRGPAELERGIAIKGRPDNTTRDRSSNSTPTFQRGSIGGTPLRGARSLMSSHPYSSEPGMRQADLSLYRSPGRALARGDTQRARSLSHPDSRHGSEEDLGLRMYPNGGTPGRQRPRMYSNSSRRDRDGCEDSGAIMVSTSTPGRSRTPGRANTPGQRSNSGGSSRGRQVYNTPSRMRAGGASRDERGRRKHSQSPSWAGSRSPVRHGQEENNRGGSRSRSRSVGRTRPPRHEPGSGEHSSGGVASALTLTPPAPARGDRSPRGGGHRGRGESHTAHILGYRRSVSVPREATYPDEPEVWGQDDRVSTPTALEVGGRRARRPRNAARRSKSVEDLTEHDVDSLLERQRSAYECRTAPSDGSWKRRHYFTSPSRHIPYKSGMGESGMPADVSWEELRSKYLKSKSQPRLDKTYSLPTYGDVISAGSVDSRESGESRPPPPPYDRVQTLTAQLSIGVPGDSRYDSAKGANGANPTRSGPSSLKRPGSLVDSAGGFSPGSRATSARAAARDAQLSAERALAAAATASRAADLAAQAAIEAEAEADAELYSARGAGSLDDVDESNLPSYLQGTPRRDNGKPASAGYARSTSVGDRAGHYAGAAGKSPTGNDSGRGWSAPEGQETSSRQENSSFKTREVLVAIDRAGERSGKKDSSWIQGNVRGADTAGGSGSGRGGGGGGGGVDSGGESSGGGASGGGGRRSRGIIMPHRNASGLTPSEELAMKRRAFVKQYSGTSTCDGESDFSLHDYPATNPGAHRRYLSENSEMTSFEGSEFSLGDSQSIEASARRMAAAAEVAPPYGRGRSSSADLASSAAKRKNSPVRSPTATPRSRGRGLSTAVKNMSEAGSSPEDTMAR